MKTIVIRVSKRNTKIIVYSEHATVTTIVHADGNVDTKTEPPY